MRAGPHPTVPLVRLAWGRSGDKGDISNIGMIARRPEYLPLLRAQVTERRWRVTWRTWCKGTVTRHDLPGMQATELRLHAGAGRRRARVQPAHRPAGQGHGAGCC
jgi:hypothetical protein